MILAMPTPVGPEHDMHAQPQRIVRSLSALSIAACALLGSAAAVAQNTPTSDPARSPSRVPALGHREVLNPLTPSFEGTWAGFTEPIRDASMGFAFPANVDEVLVKGGQRVTKGQLLIRATDAEPAAQVALQERRARNTYQVQSAENDLRLRQLEFENQEKIKAGGGGNEFEFEESKARRDAAQIQLDAARETLQEQSVLLTRLQAELARYHIKAPFDGEVESVKVHPGSVLSQADTVIRVVDTSTFSLTATPSIREGLELGLKPGSPAWVVLDVPGEPVVLVASVSEVSPVVESAARMMKIKLQCPNPQGLPAGLSAYVRFVAPTGDWASRIARASDQPSNNPGDAASTRAIAHQP